MLISAFCEKCIAAKQIIRRNVENICDLNQAVQRRLCISAFVLAIVSNSGLKQIGHLLRSKAALLAEIIQTI
nr:MAG TPA: hypothetical protein [Caudoviricetes sp.]